MRRWQKSARTQDVWLYDYKGDYLLNLSRRTHDLGRWLQATPEYERWLTNYGCLRYIGIPGCGKTLIAAAIVEDLLAQNENVVYFFFTFSSPISLTALAVFTSLIRQVLELYNKKQIRIPRNVHELFKDDSLALSVPRLRLLLETLILDQDIIYVIDGLDECTDLDQLVQHLAVAARTGRVFLSSRGCSTLDSLEATVIKNVDQSQSADIAQFIDTEIGKLHLWPRVSSDQALVDRIIESLKANANGM